MGVQKLPRVQRKQRASQNVKKRMNKEKRWRQCAGSDAEGLYLEVQEGQRMNGEVLYQGEAQRK